MSEGRGGGRERERAEKSRVERKGQSSIGRSIEKVRRYAIERCGIRFIIPSGAVVLLLLLYLTNDHEGTREQRSKVQKKTRC